MKNSNFIFLEENDTYIAKSAIEYLTVRKAGHSTFSVCIGNGKTNFTLTTDSIEGAETRRLELLNELVG